MESRFDTITTKDGGEFVATVFLPPNGEGPGILLLQEIFGVGDFLTAKARDLAAQGYVVLCPDVFWRVEPGVALAHDEDGLQRAFALMGRYSEEVDDATKVSDLSAALAHLRGLDEVGGRKVAVMGYCLGGYLAFLVACNDDVDACVSYYGSGTAAALDAADGLTAPAIFHYGGADPFIPAAEVEQIRACLGDRANVAIHEHAGAGHAFENFLAEQFSNPEAAAASWELTTAFLERTLR